MLKAINITSIILGIIGTYMMYHFSPKANSQTYLYRDEEMKYLRKRDFFKNRMVRLGMLLLCISFLLQLVLTLCSPNK